MDTAPRTEKPSLMAEFKEFILRGNIVELAVAIIIGLAFVAVIGALVDGVLMPLVAAIFGEPNFDALIADVGDGRILYGTLITATINFLIIALAMFFTLKFVARMQRPKVIDVTDEPKMTEEERLLREIRDLLAGRVRGGSGPF